MKTVGKISWEQIYKDVLDSCDQDLGFILSSKHKPKQAIAWNHEGLWYVFSNQLNLSHRHTYTHTNKVEFEGFSFFMFFLLYTHVFAFPNALRKPFPRT